MPIGKANIVRETASSENNDNWTSDKIHSIIERIQAANSKRATKENIFARRLLVNGQPIEFIIDSGSPVSLISKREFNRIPDIKPVKNNYKDVNDNDIIFEGQTLGKIETETEKLLLPLLITKNRTNPLLGLDWMTKLDIKLKENRKKTQYKKNQRTGL